MKLKQTIKECLSCQFPSHYIHCCSAFSSKVKRPLSTLPTRLQPVSPPRTQPHCNWLWLPSWEKFMAGIHRGPSRAHSGLRAWRLGQGRSCGEAADLREPSPLPAPEEGGCRALQLRAAAQVPALPTAPHSTIVFSYVPFPGASKQTQGGPGPGRPTGVARTPARPGCRRAVRGSPPRRNVRLSLTAAHHVLLEKDQLGLESWLRIPALPLPGHNTAGK